MKVKFKVLELCDSVKQGSELVVGNIYTGILINNTVWFNDRAGCDWVFYVNDTCELC